jgi:hypothetical protein
MTCRAYLFPPASSVIVMAASERSRVEAERQLAAAAARYRELSPRCGWAAAQLAGSTLAERPPARGGGARRRSAMLRRMKVTMLLADAASVADGNLGLLGGGWNMTGPRAWHDQACAELEARVPWEGIAMKRWGAA